MKNIINCLTLTTKILHHPDKAIAFRARAIEHVIETHANKLREEYPKMLSQISSGEIVKRVIGKNNGNISEAKEEQLNDITSLLVEKYPELKYFHNHNPDGSKNNIDYPLIQYRSKKGKAVIVAYNEAIPIVESWLSSADWNSWLSYRVIADKKLTHEEIQITKDPVYYRLMDWLALNDEGYKKWIMAPSLKEKAVILDQALTGHVRRLAQSFIESKDYPNVIGEVIMIKKVKTIKSYHHTEMAFNILCKMNLKIPPTLAIGRATSLGYGTQGKTVWQGESSSVIAEIEKEHITM